VTDSQQTRPRGFVVETWDLPAEDAAFGPPESFEETEPELAGYRVEGLLGQGGMGSVYRARDLADERWVAIKVSAALQPDLATRLELEAQIQRQIHHPAVPRVLGEGWLGDGRRYLIQSLVPGARSLAEASVSASCFEILAWAATAAEALASAHGRCVTHGDVKPDNLLIDARGQLSLVDWGVARLGVCGAPAPAELDAELKLLARPKQSWIQGTLAYMPPEQLRGVARPASDVYALAVVLIEVLRGQHPLVEHFDSSARLIEAIESREPRRIPADLPCPPEVRALLGRCLERDLGARPASAEVARVLQRALRSERGADTRERGRPSRSAG
jgi:eukaryotic-like serine/threonine-protein kinase